jgi:hypothetical protein
MLSSSKFYASENGGNGRKMITWGNLLSCFLSLPRSWGYPAIQHKWDVCQHAITNSQYENHPDIGIHHISLHRIRNSFLERRALPFCDLVQYVLRNSAAMNPEDFVYGLFGLLDNHDRDQLIFDYEMEPMEIYKRAGTLLWKRYPERTLSELLPILYFHGNDNGFPSWVPDFASQAIRGWKDHRTIQTGKAWRSQDTSPFNPDRGTLVLRGIIFDVIDKVIVTPIKFNEIEEIAPFLSHIEELLLAAKNRPIPTSHPLKSLSSLKHEETVLQTLTVSIVETEELFQGLEDEKVWALLMGREILFPSTMMTSEEGNNIHIFARLGAMLRGKLLGARY